MEKQKLVDAHKYNLWKDRLLSSGMDIHHVDELYTRHNGHGDVLFSLVYTDATTPEKYLILVRQRRICDGSLTYEHPAGMLDNERDAAAVAAREVFEETGIAVEKNMLIALNENPCFPSTGTSDEAMYFFYCELVMTKKEIDAYHNQTHGMLSEHEYIETFVVPFAEGHNLITNSNGILLDFLYLKAVDDWELMKKL
jgi:ADP-sugar diphosphatase